jgi:phosphohistidine swiveling domain-containing protein
MSAITFEPPGPGEWMLDTTHHGRRPTSGYMRDLTVEEFERGMAHLLERYGLPLVTVEGRLVNGCFYVRPKAVGEGARASAPPPRPIMKIIARLHPELRRRNKTAAAAWAEQRWRNDVDAWFGGEREATVRRLLDRQATPVGELSDDELVEHVAALTADVRELMYLGMATHGGDLIPNGDYFAHCAAWGLDLGAAAALLRGSSPATAEVARLLQPVAEAVAGADPRPTSIAEVRALGPAVADAVDRWLDLHGWRVIDSDDLDATTLAERPDLQLAVLLSAGRSFADVTPPDPSALRARVPPDRRALFDELLAEARYGLRLRDDNVGVRWNWPVGLLRRALLEVGRRLQGRGLLVDAAHVIELDPTEVAPLLRAGDADGPAAAAVAERAARRLAIEAAGPPSTLGEPEAPPPLDAFPAPMARATRAMLAMIRAMEGEARPEPLHGTGVGEAAYRGTARVVSGADDAFARLEEGDVLVASFTGPAYNSILGLVGALVVEEGGPLCHAAIVARELGVPAVVGAAEATTLVVDGAKIEVDPVAGAVRLL